MFEVDAVKTRPAAPSQEVDHLVILGEGDLTGDAVGEDLVESEGLGHVHTRVSPHALFRRHVTCRETGVFTSLSLFFRECG